MVLLKTSSRAIHHFSRFFGPLALLAATICAADNPTNLSFLNQDVSFEPNMGQSASSALFLSRGLGHPVELRHNSVTFRVDPTRSIQMNLLNAANNGTLEGQSILPGTVNYFSGPDQTQWHTGIPTYERVAEHNVYPGVDLAFYGNSSHFEYDFLIQPNSNLAKLQLSFSGADLCSVDAHGNLVLKAGNRQLSLLKPVAYQVANGGKSKEPVVASYRLNTDGSISFNIGAYDHARTLIIDPVLSFSEYLANSVSAFAMDKAGSMYVVTSSPYSSSSITKLNAAGTIVYTTAFGYGLAPDAVAVDSSGNAYITGWAFYNSTLPVSASAYSSVVPQYISAFLLKISANGSSLPYGTYLGGADNTTTVASSIALDTSGNAYVAGSTQSTTFPTTAGVYQAVNPPFNTAGFVSKFNPALSGKASLVYSTLIGSAQSGLLQILNGIAVDVSGDAYVTGGAAPGYPVTKGAFQYAGADYLDGGVYVTKFNAAATALVYSAYLGYGTGSAIAVDTQGNAYVTGTVQYADFPVTAGAYQTIYPGGFVTKLNPAGSSEVFSTFLSGPSGQEAGSLGTDNVAPAGIALTPGCPATTPAVINCNVYVLGTTGTFDWNAINAIQDAPTSGSSSLSAFVTELSSTGQSALLSTYLSGTGGAETTPGPFIAVDAAGNINLAGNLANAYETWFPVTVPVSTTQNPAFLARISPNAGTQLLPEPWFTSIGALVGLNSSLVHGTQQITLGNYGTSPVTISSIKISPALFTETNNCGTTLVGGGSCTLSVDFTPAAAGQTSGSITVQSNSGNGTLNIGLTGFGTNSDFLQTSVQKLNFDNQAIQTSSKSQTFTLSNIGNTAVSPTFSISGSPQFLITNSCAQLASHASCNITVAFVPSQVGLQIGDMEIYDAPNSLVAVMTLTGTGTVPGVSTSLIVAPSALPFGSALVGSTDTASGTAGVQVTNTSAVPVTIQSIATAGDFQILDTSCYSPVQLNPFASCYVSLGFTPTATGTRTGTLTLTDSVSSKPQTVSLSGTGLASSQKAEIYPASYMMAPDQPAGTIGPDQAVTLQNTGTAPISIYKIVTTGPFRVSSDHCTGTSVAGTNDDGTGVYSFCTVNVDFIPTATGAFTGTLTLYSSDVGTGSPHTVHLTGTGITTTGTLTLSGNALIFPTQAIGTSAPLGITFSNPGDAPVQVTAIATTGDFSQSLGTSCSALPFSVPPGSALDCYWNVTFSPSAAGTRAGSLTVHSSAGVQTVALTGTGVAANFFRQMIPIGSMSFGSQVVGQSGTWQWVYFYHSKPTTANPYPTLSVSGANAGDFSVDYDPGCGAYTPNVSVCSVWIYFTPSATGARTASVTFTDWAGSQILKLTGTGLSATPQSSVSQSFITFSPPQTQGTTSSGNFVSFTNSSAARVSLGNLAVTSNFIILHSADTCSGATLAAGKSCNFQVEYSPSLASPAANRLDSGTVTITNSSGKLLNSIGLGGYSMPPTYAALASQSEVNFAQQQALGFTSDYQTNVSLLNTGNTALTIGTINGTNLGLAGTSAEFSVLPANQGLDGCSGTTLQAGATCNVQVTFTPNVLGASTGTLNFPVTYTNKTTATVQVKLSGVGITAVDHAVLSPASVAFADLGVGTTSPASVVTLINTGNEPVTVGVLVGINTVVGSTLSGEFFANLPYGTNGCSLVTLNPGANCAIQISLTPSGTQTRTGSISFPLTFLDKHTMTRTLSLTGIGLSAVPQVQISPAPVVFEPAVQGNPSATVQQTIVVANTGNAPVTFGKDSISTNPTDFQIYNDPCASSTLAAGTHCTIALLFSPAATSTGTRTGVLTIADNAGGPHAVALSGKAVSAPQQIELSQTSLTFATQKAGTTSVPQVIYITNQGPQEINVPVLVLGSKNAADFQVNNSCYYLAHSCSISVVFAPQKGATGARTATITETDTAPGSPRLITLTGTAN